MLVYYFTEKGTTYHVQDYASKHKLTHATMCNALLKNKIEGSIKDVGWRAFCGNCFKSFYTLCNKFITKDSIDGILNYLKQSHNITLSNFKITTKYGILIEFVLHNTSYVVAVNPDPELLLYQVNRQVQFNTVKYQEHLCNIILQAISNRQSVKSWQVELEEGLF